MLAAPEFVVTELVEMLGEIEVAAELQHRVFADGVVRSQKCAKANAGHQFPQGLLFWGDGWCQITWQRGGAQSAEPRA
jgi:hypothetical protein